MDISRLSCVCRLSLVVGVLSFNLFVSAENGQSTKDPFEFILGGESIGRLRAGMSGDDGLAAPRPSVDGLTGTLVLAANRTNRLDILRGFKRYQGGWNITNRHYWASVGFTGASGFILALLWFLSFGVALMVHHCCGWRINIDRKGSDRAQRICLMLLILFTCAAAIGCILLSVGQDKFHDEAMHTLKFVVNQSDYTVETLRNVTEYLSLAKTINVAQVFLPSNVMTDIDKLNIDLNMAADTLTEKTNENAGKIVKAFNAVRSALITVAALMFLLALVGSILSILGHKHAINIFVTSGWLLVAITFILYGVFVILNSAISDACVAMGEWVDNPQASTTLSNILPCVDQGTTNETLIQSKLVITDIVNVVNTYVYTFANSNPSPSEFAYYNQSGPLMPPLCYPYDSQLQTRQCAAQEVSMENASMVWQDYLCDVSPSGLCMTPGRLLPDIYRQLAAALNETYALEYYTPRLLNLQNCKFVRDTFEEITTSYCPPLERNLKTLNAGLGLISVGVLLCLVLWILYANRPQREEAFAKFSLPVKVIHSENRDSNKNELTSDVSRV